MQVSKEANREEKLKAQIESVMTSGFKDASLKKDFF